MSHEVRLEPLNGNSPLASHLNQLLKSPEIRRARTFAELLDGFHLKNTVTSAVEGRKAIIDGRSVVNFGSANYLGLEMHPDVLKAAREALTEWGNHSGCSRIFSSQTNILELERELADLTRSEAALVFPNTSSTHQGIVPVLFGSPDTIIFLDRYAHTSMHQAALIAVAKGARIVRVDIRDLTETAKRIASQAAKTKVVMIDGVYSMQGTVPDLKGLQQTCDSTGAMLYIDDAHGIAVYGENGGGVVELFGLSYDNMILTGGLQKGLGAYGGFAAGSRSLIDYLRVSARSYIFSGTLQPQAVDGSLAAIRICKSDEGKKLRKRLHEISRDIRQRLQEMNYVVVDGDSPIVSVLIGPELRTLMAGRHVFDSGVYVNSVLYPATPKNEGLLRISLNAIHTDEEVELLIKAFKELTQYLGGVRRPLLTNLSYAREITARQMSRRLPRISSNVKAWVKNFGV